MMLGGVICGYWATGKLTTATAPARVMTMDRTDAKIGRSMKKCENMAALQSQKGRKGEGEKGRPGYLPSPADGPAVQPPEGICPEIGFVVSLSPLLPFSPSPFRFCRVNSFPRGEDGRLGGSCIL